MTCRRWRIRRQVVGPLVAATLVAGLLVVAAPVRAQVGDPGLTYVMQAGAPLAPSQLSHPLALASDGTYVYVLDGGRILKLRASTMAFVKAYAGTVDQPVNARDVVVSHGMLYLAAASQVIRLSTKLDGSGWKACGSGATWDQGFLDNRGIAIDGSMLYVLDAGGQVVRLSTALDGSGWKTIEWAYGTGPWQFANPTSIAVGDGNVFVGDGSDRIVRFSKTLDGSGWKTYGSTGHGKGQFNIVAGLVVDGTSLVVADARNSRVVRLSTKLDGSGWRTFGKAGTGTGRFGEPRDVALAGGSLYVADASTFVGSPLEVGYPRVERMSARFTTAGWKEYVPKAPPWTLPGQYGDPLSAATDGVYVYAIDGSANAVKKVRASDLGFVAQFGTLGTGVGQFNNPCGIALAGGYLYVSDSENNRIVRLATALDGSGWMAFGAKGPGDGQFDFPTGIAATADRLYVSDMDNQRVVTLSTALDGSGWKAFEGSDSSGWFDSPVGIAVHGGSLFVADVRTKEVVRLSTALDGTGWLSVPRSDNFWGFEWPTAIAVGGGSLLVIDDDTEINRFSEDDLSFIGLVEASKGHTQGIATDGSWVFTGYGWNDTWNGTEDQPGAIAKWTMDALP